MLDIHNHLLPLTDNGATHVEETIRMAHRAAAEEVRRIIATPYATHATAEEVQLIVAELNVLLAQRQIPVLVYPGHQVRLTLGLRDAVHQGHVLTLADTAYLLIDCPDDSLPVYTEEIMMGLIEDGYLPILAQPEDNVELLQNPERLIRLMEKGVRCQLATHSILGHHGEEKRLFCQRALQEGWVHFIASNAKKATDGLGFMPAYHQIEQWCGASVVDRLQWNAEQILVSPPIV
ncbi:tyrosine-protein phosphatase [Exiguobacterium acetylicum]